MSKSDASGLANTVIDNFCRAFRITSTVGKNEAVLALIEALEYYAEEQVNRALDNYRESQPTPRPEGAWEKIAGGYARLAEEAEARAARLRSALEIIANRDYRNGLEDDQDVAREALEGEK